ncbi:MAG: serine hydrolase domain-containing protein, partial [Pseudomonadota bacterium]
MKPLRTLLFTATFVLTPLAQADDAARIERYVGEALGLGFNPALGVAVVRGDGEVLVDAWGRRDVGFAAPDARTRFYIASATKSLTGTAAATLVAEGNLDLAAPVSEYADVSPPEGLPPQQFSVGALLTHTHGMENDPLVVRTAYSGQHDPALLRELVAQGTTTDSAAFDYSNEGYVIFGLALTELSGGSDWRQGVRQRVLEPLGMSDSTAHLSQVPSDAIAMPFDYRPGDGLERIPLYKSDATLHAAGGHFMSPRDASRWLRANLTHGIIDGQRRLPEEVFAMTQQARVETGSDFGDYRRESYGLGWHRGRYDGDVLVHHFGSFPGYRSHLSFMPERDIGVAVFTNTGGPGFPVVDLVA